MGQTHFKHKLHTSNWRLKLTFLGSGGVGQVVSMLAFYFDDSSSNPAEVYSLFENFENKQKEAGDGLF